MHEPKNVAEAFLIESGADFEASKALFRNGCYARCVYLAQQCVEKAVKAALALRGIFTTDHNLSAIFQALYGQDLGAEMERLVTAVQALERLGSRARFPLFHRADLPIWIPSRELRKREAGGALTDAEFVYQLLRGHLTSAEGLKVGE